MWTTRREAENALEGPLQPFAQLIQETFSLIDETVLKLQEIDPPFGVVCALVLVKGRNLALGCYSLALDALAQEAGALFRPLIESVELLTYLRLDPTRVSEAVDERLPSAGKIAERIGGQLKFLREHLNTHASHLSVSEKSMAHLVRWSEGGLKSVQPFDLEVLRQNLGTLLPVTVWLLSAGVNCVTVGSGTTEEGFIGRAENVQDRAFALAKLGAASAPREE